MNTDQVTKDYRSELQREADKLDCDVYNLVCRAESLADRIRVAGPILRQFANRLDNANPRSCAPADSTSLLRSNQNRWHMPSDHRTEDH